MRDMEGKSRLQLDLSHRLKIQETSPSWINLSDQKDICSPSALRLAEANASSSDASRENGRRHYVHPGL